MGRQAGALRPGSLSTRLVDCIRQASAPLSRAALGKLLPKDRLVIGQTLTRLARSGVVWKNDDGCWCAVPNAVPKPQRREDEPEPAPQPPVGEALAGQLYAIRAKAHSYRRAGCPDKAASLLERAAQRPLPDPVRTDLLALASLFAAHRELYPQVALRRAAA